MVDLPSVQMVLEDPEEEEEKKKKDFRDTDCQNV